MGYLVFYVFTLGREMEHSVAASRIQEDEEGSL